MAVDSKLYFHNTFDALIEHESWGKIKSEVDPESKKQTLREVASVILKAVDRVDSLENLQGIVRKWLLVNSAELDQSDRSRLIRLKKCFMQVDGKSKFNPDGVQRLADDGPEGLKARIVSIIDPHVPLEVNYERLKQYCLQNGIKIQVCERFFIRNLFERYPDPQHKEALASNCLEYRGFDVMAVQELLCDQFRHLQIEDEAARCRLANVVLIKRPDLFLRHLQNFRIRDESNRFTFAMTALFHNLDLFINHYQRFNIQSDASNLRIALEFALFAPELASEHVRLFTLAPEHREIFNKFILCRNTCALIFDPEADPHTRQYQTTLMQWVKFDFINCAFPQALIDRWYSGLVFLLKKTLDVRAAQEVINWAIARGILTTGNFAQLAEIHPANRLLLGAALCVKDPEWGIKNLAFQ